MNVNDEMKRLMDTFGQEDAELDYELRAYYTDDEPFAMVRHPLVYSVPHDERLNAMCNARLKQKKELLETALNDGDIAGAVFLHERPYRVNALQQHIGKLNDCDYWSLVGDVWTDSENINQNYDLWQDLLKSKRPCREDMMDEDEQAKLKGYMDRGEDMVVWRGISNDELADRVGMSWTTSVDQAVWFAKRLGRKGCTLKLVVDPSRIVACFDGRNEHEVVIPDAASLPYEIILPEVDET